MQPGKLTTITKSEKPGGRETSRKLDTPQQTKEMKKRYRQQQNKDKKRQRDGGNAGAGIASCVRKVQTPTGAKEDGVTRTKKNALDTVRFHGPFNDKLCVLL